MELSRKLVSRVFPEFHRVAIFMVYTRTRQRFINRVYITRCTLYISLVLWIKASYKLIKKTINSSFISQTAHASAKRKKNLSKTVRKHSTTERRRWLHIIHA